MAAVQLQADTDPDVQPDGDREPLQAMKERAAAGDLAGLLDALAKHPNVVSLRRTAILLRFAVRQASRKAPHAFCREVFREGTAFLSYVQTRLHAQALLQLAETDQREQPDSAALQQGLTEGLLSQIERVMRLTMELAQAWASTSRHWKLGRRGRRARGPISSGDVYRQLVDAGVIPYAGNPSADE